MAKQTSKPETNAVEAAAAETVQPETASRPARKTRPKIDPTEQIEVRNNTVGRLVYSSPRMMGYTIVWDSHGDVQLMDFAEVQTMKNAHKRFFQDNWITIDDPDVIQALGISNLYKNAVNGNDIKALFEMNPNVIRKRVAAMNDGMKSTVRSAAKLAIDNGTLDSVQRIRVLEEALDCSLM